MKKAEKYSLFICLLLSASALAAACASETETPPAPESSSVPVTESYNAETEEHGDASGVLGERLEVPDNLPETDCGGEIFRVFNWSDECVSFFAPGEENGDVINDSSYRRQVEIEERFNCKLEAVCSGAANSVEHTAAARKLVMGGDDSYQLYQLHSMQGPNLSMEHMLVNLYDVPHLDFSKPWWPRFVVDELTLFNQMYVFANPITHNIISGSCVYFFNRDLINTFDLEDPYTIVREGKWTLDKLGEMVKGCYLDLNGDGKTDAADRFGHTTFPYEGTYGMVSAAVPMLEKTKDSLVITANNERMTTYIEKAVAFFHSPDVTVLEQSEYRSLFIDGRSVFTFGGISDTAGSYRDTGLNFGVIPMPKYDEAQENYITMAGRDLYGIPATVQNLDFAGLILEALSAEGYKQVLPSYYENALKGKFLRDEAYYEEAYQAMDTIEQSLTLTFSYMYQTGFTDAVSDLNKKGSTDFASMYAKDIKKNQKRVDEILAFFGNP